MATEASHPFSRYDRQTPQLYIGSLSCDTGRAGTTLVQDLSSPRKDLSSTASSRSTDTGSSSYTPTNPNVKALRDHLLREARNERQRCLESVEAQAAERLRVLSRQSYDTATQTAPVTIISAPEKGLDSTVWSKGDDEAQAEAVRALQRMTDKRDNSEVDRRLKALEEQLLRQRMHMQNLEEQLTVERSQKDYARQQVMWLELDLDAKEASLQAAERKIEQQGLDLQVARAELGMMSQVLAQRPNVVPVPGNESKLEQRLTQQERQIALKDDHISRLLAVLGQRMAPVA